VAAAPFRYGHYRLAFQMARVYPDFWQSLRRHITAEGAYPYRCQVRTPLGTVKPTLFTPHDMYTLSEVFCREDYAADSTIRVVVDLGSNIGLSALYFLTRNPEARCYLFEPVPRNVQRLRQNLAGYEDRYVLHEQAVGVTTGNVRFGIEPTGRYGGIGAETGESIVVYCRHVNDVLQDVLGREELVDVLKLDTEGLEMVTVAAIRAEHLERIRIIYFEDPRSAPLHGDLFEHRLLPGPARNVNRLRNRRLGLRERTGGQAVNHFVRA
jgi:FkbM family methyltransferase